jgi:hypothetical protein
MKAYEKFCLGKDCIRFENGSAFAYKNEVTVTLALNIKVNRDLEDIYLKGGPDNILGVKTISPFAEGET